MLVPIIIGIFLIVIIASKKSNPRQNQFLATSNLTPEYIERQRRVFEKYGFDLMPGETMSPEIAEWVLRNERDWRNEQKHQRLINLRKRLNLDHIDGHEFERICADILEFNGYECEVTQGSGDHGADIIAKKDGVSYAIQCKNYSSDIGNRAVQEAHAGRTYYRTDKAVVLTNSEFTRQAIEDAKKMGVELWNGEILANLLQGVE